MSKDNKREAQPESDLPEQGEVFAQRRQVIRGMASIPVALTLSNGAALANTSSHACLSGETTNPSTLNCGEADDPDWNDIDVNENNNDPAKFCVTYANEPTPGTLQVLGYVDPSSSTGFVDQNGGPITPVSAGYPLRASCATSFMN